MLIFHYLFTETRRKGKKHHITLRGEKIRPYCYISNRKINAGKIRDEDRLGYSEKQQSC